MNFYRKSGLVAGSSLCCDGMKFFRDDVVDGVRLIDGNEVSGDLGGTVVLQAGGVNLFGLSNCPWCGAAITVKDSTKNNPS